VSRSGFIWLDAAKRLARSIVQSFDVRTPEAIRRPQALRAATCRNS
jgi:hypothetical protein